MKYRIVEKGIACYELQYREMWWQWRKAHTFLSYANARIHVGKLKEEARPGIVISEGTIP